MRSDFPSPDGAPASGRGTSRPGRPPPRTRTARRTDPRRHQEAGRRPRRRRAQGPRQGPGRPQQLRTPRPRPAPHPPRAFPQWPHTYDHHRGHTALKGRPPAGRVPDLTGRYGQAKADSAGDFGWSVDVLAVRPPPQPSPRARPPRLPGPSRTRRRPPPPQAARPPHRVGHGCPGPFGRIPRRTGPYSEATRTTCTTSGPCMPRTCAISMSPELLGPVVSRIPEGTGRTAASRSIASA